MRGGPSAGVVCVPRAIATPVPAPAAAAARRLAPPRLFPLEEAIVCASAFRPPQAAPWLTRPRPPPPADVAPDELVEVTPSRLRLRKRLLDPSERDKYSRSLAKSLKAESK